MVHKAILTQYYAKWDSGKKYEFFGTYDSYGIETLEVASDEAWEGLTIAVSFSVGDMVITVPLHDGVVEIPHEAISLPCPYTNPGKITFIGAKSGTQRISFDLGYVVASHEKICIEDPQPTPSIWESFLNEVKEDADRADAAANAAKISADKANNSAIASENSAQKAQDALSDVNSAKGVAIEEITYLTNSSKTEIQNAGKDQISEISAEGQTQLSDIQEEGQKQQSAIAGSGTEALEAIGSLKTFSIQSIQNEGNSQISSISQKGQEQISLVAQQGNSSIAEINSTKEQAVSALEQKQDSIEADLQEFIDAASQQAENASNSAIEAAKSASDALASLNELDTKKDSALNEINSAGSSQVGAVNQAGQSQVSNINNTAQSKIAEIEAANARSPQINPETGKWQVWDSSVNSYVDTDITAKGDKGDTGDAAGFGTVEASVDNSTGVPSVNVETSGENTAKNFSFEFSGLKGEPGADGLGVPSPTKDDAGKVPVATGNTQAPLYELGTPWPDSYTKSEIRSLYAPAIWDIAPLAAEHDIYAAEGAPLRVTQQGETEQQTTTGAQLLDIKRFGHRIMLDASITPNTPLSPLDTTGYYDNITSNGYGNNQAAHLVGYTEDSVTVDASDGYGVGLLFPASPGDSFAWSNAQAYMVGYHFRSEAGEYIAGSTGIDASSIIINVPEGASYLMLVLRNNGETTYTNPMLNAGSTALPWEPYTGGAPSPSPDYPQEIAGIDSPVTAQTSDGQTSTSISMDIGSPLYGDGSVVDTVANDVPSGCDKVIVLDGSEDEAWAVYATATGENRAILTAAAPDAAQEVTGLAQMYISDTLPAVSAVDTYNSTTGLAIYQGNVYVYIPGITDVAGFRAALAANPLKIWYRSTAYTDAADLHIDKGTRRWHMVELDGTEEWADNIGAGTSLGTRISGLRGTGTGWTTVGKVVPATTQAQTEMTASMASGWLYLYTQMSKGDLTAWLAAQKSAGTPVRVLYQLATPEEYASDPHTLPALGSLPETVKATGESTVEYSADTKHYIDAKFAALSAAMLGG